MSGWIKAENLKDKKLFCAVGKGKSPWKDVGEAGLALGLP